jgi:hypothetical protein
MTGQRSVAFAVLFFQLRRPRQNRIDPFPIEAFNAEKTFHGRMKKYFHHRCTQISPDAEPTFFLLPGSAFIRL